MSPLQSFNRVLPSVVIVIAFCSVLSFGSLKASAQTNRMLRVQQSIAARGQNQSIVVEMDAVGNENAVGFSLNFDASQLRYVSASTFGGSTGATMNLNTAMVGIGRLGIALALPGGQKLGLGRQPIAIVTFTVLAAETVSNTFLNFGDQPIPREVVDTAANAVAANFSGATLTFAQPMIAVSAASLSTTKLSNDSIATAFGNRLATQTQAANSLPLPTSLAGSSLIVKDRLGVERNALLFFVSPTQVNFLIPVGTASGSAAIIAKSSDGILSVTNTEIAAVAPSLFSASATGQGLAVAVVQRRKANGAISYEATSRFDSNLGRLVAIPIDLSQPTDQVFLLLYGTGIKNRSSLSAVQVQLGGTSVEALYAGATTEFAGLDQVNIRLPQSLAGRGTLNIGMIIDGQSGNTVTVSIK